MSMIFRKLLPQESLLYRSLRLACLENEPDNFGSTFEEESKIVKLKYESLIEWKLEDHFMFGAFDDAALVGIAGFDRLDGQRTCHRGNVEQVYVDANHRGQNVALRLLRALIDDAFKLEGVEQLQLGVMAGNDAAINLYQKLGFKTYGIQKNYFKVGNRYMDQQFMQLFKSDYGDK
jgi:ribosomal protein S18 acetylase RimI-like enzyme